MKPTLLAIIGKPLSGKDTQADLLVASHPEAVNISTGQKIRDVKREGPSNKFWPIISPFIPMMEAGIKLPDEPTLVMLGQEIQENLAAGKSLLIIAGSPRGLVQLAAFEDMAQKLGTDFIIVHVDASDEETYRRSAARNDGRDDDTPEVHAIRLQEYRTHILPIVEKLTREQKIVHLDGMQTPERVFEQLQREIGHHLQDPEIAMPDISLPAMARR